jgi:hypothetical protein
MFAFLNDVGKANPISYTMRTAALSIVKRLAVFYDPLASGANVVRVRFELTTLQPFRM